MSKEKSKVQKAIEHIYAHPGCRSDALSAIFQCEAKNVPAFMKDVLAAGLIISCKVERPGQRPTHEFKPSAAAPDKCPADWLEWKRSNIAPPAKPLQFKASGPRDGLQKSGSARETQAASGDITAAVAAGSSPSGKQHLPSSEAAIETQAGSHGPEEATTSASVPAVSDLKVAITPNLEAVRPYTVELIEHPGYSVKVGGIELPGFTEESNWNGLTELRNAAGYKLIVAKEETLFSKILGGSSTPIKAAIVTGTPALIKQLFPNLDKAA